MLTDVSFRQIIKDDTSNVPYEVTFTKLDNQPTGYIYNFYKIQLLETGTKVCLLVRWGQVGTVGNIRKIFYDSKEEAINDFRQIFLNKSGNNWSNVNNHIHSEDMYRIVESNKKQAKPFLLEVNFDFEELRIKSFKNNLNPNIKNLLLNLVKHNDTCFKDIVKYEFYYTLSSSLLEQCSGELPTWSLNLT